MATLDYRTTCELNRPVTIKHLDGMFFSQDVQANRIVVSVVRGGVNEDLSGTVSANIIRADGETVVQTGEISGNVASVTMPAAAYAVPGAIAVFVKHTESGVTSTIAAVTGYVYKSTTDTIVDPGTIIPSIQDLLESIDDAIEDLEEAIAAIPQDYQDLEDDVSDLKNEIDDLEENAVKTVNGVYPDEDGDVDVNSFMSADCADLLEDVLSEALYGSDQMDNIITLCTLLKGHNLVSLSAELTGLALIGTPYDELDISVTGTYSDQTTATVYHFTVSSGTVVEGSNTVTISYRGVSTTLTFTATTIITHTVTYNLQGITSSNTSTIVQEGSSYTTEFTVAEGYEFSSCVVTMGGVDVTATVYSNLEILIQEITGDIVITAIAIKNVELDILVPIVEKFFSNMYLYSDNYETQLTNFANSAHVDVSEYPALNACRIKWKITNNSEEQVTLNSTAIGCVSSADNWKTNERFRAAYCEQITISGNNLDAGASLEGTYDLPKGFQLVFIRHYQTVDKIDVDLTGNYEPDMFTEYEKLTSTGSATYGSFRGTTWYADDGNTQILQKNSATYVFFDEDLPAGEYDVIGRIVPVQEEIARRLLSDRLIAGGVQDNTFTSVYNCFGLSVDNTYIFPYLFVKGRMEIGSSGMKTISALDYPETKTIELYVKEVTN